MGEKDERYTIGRYATGSVGRREPPISPKDHGVPEFERKRKENKNGVSTFPKNGAYCRLGSLGKAEPVTKVRPENENKIFYPSSPSD